MAAALQACDRPVAAPRCICPRLSTVSRFCAHHSFAGAAPKRFSLGAADAVSSAAGLVCAFPTPAPAVPTFAATGTAHRQGHELARRPSPRPPSPRLYSPTSRRPCLQRVTALPRTWQTSHPAPPSLRAARYQGQQHPQPRRRPVHKRHLWHPCSLISYGPSYMPSAHHSFTLN